MTERSPLLKEMDALLTCAIKKQCCPQTIALLKAAIEAQEFHFPDSSSFAHAAADQEPRNAAGNGPGGANFP